MSPQPAPAAGERVGRQQWIIGSVAERVVRAAKVPVLLVRSKPE